MCFLVGGMLILRFLVQMFPIRLLEFFVLIGRRSVHRFHVRCSTRMLWSCSQDCRCTGVISHWRLGFTALPCKPVLGIALQIDHN